MDAEQNQTCSWERMLNKAERERDALADALRKCVTDEAAVPHWSVDRARRRFKAINEIIAAALAGTP